MYELEENGVCTSERSEILRMQYRFYNTLYTTNKKVNFGLKNVKGTKINSTDYTKLESDITNEKL